MGSLLQNQTTLEGEDGFLRHVGEAVSKFINWDLPINPTNYNRYWTGSSISIIPCNWQSGQFHTGRKRC